MKENSLNMLKFMVDTMEPGECLPLDVVAGRDHIVSMNLSRLHRYNWWIVRTVRAVLGCMGLLDVVAINFDVSHAQWSSNVTPLLVLSTFHSPIQRCRSGNGAIGRQGMHFGY
jgi:hypothetical protein